MYNTPYQLKLPLEIEKIIEISDPVYTFSEVLNQIDLKRYLVIKENRTGRRRFDSETLLKVILFAFMEHGYVSTREIEKLCKTDIRFMWLLQEEKAPSHMTIDNFMNHCLTESIENIFNEINRYIFDVEKVDLEHIYIDGTKLEANANKYSWVWKKSSLKNRHKTFDKIRALLEEINKTIVYQGVKFDIRNEYAIEYLEQVAEQYVRLVDLHIVRGKGHRKSTEQKHYDKLIEYTDKLKKYAEHINICGESRNSYSKTDNGATFFRMKTDYMGNDQLLPAYNVQVGVADEYIAVVDVNQYRSDMDCFIPLMDKFSKTYGFYPQYPVADAGYGSYNNYLFCQQKGMKKFMKFTMFNKETTDKKYHEDMFRAVNFKRDESGNLICPNGKKFKFMYNRPVKGNKFGRTEEMYQCEDCTGCPRREKCHKSEKNRIIRLNEELTSFHQEVIDNLECIHGALLRMNRSIQAEGSFGDLKQDMRFRRYLCKGNANVLAESILLAMARNVNKLHNKIQNNKTGTHLFPLKRA